MCGFNEKIKQGMICVQCGSEHGQAVEIKCIDNECVYNSNNNNGYNKNVCIAFKFDKELNWKDTPNKEFPWLTETRICNTKQIVL